MVPLVRFRSREPPRLPNSFAVVVLGVIVTAPLPGTTLPNTSLALIVAVD